MPRPLATLIVGIGGAVVIFAGYVATTNAFETETAAPNVVLSTATPGAADDQTSPDDINVLVTDAKDKTVAGVTVELTSFAENEGDFVVVESAETDRRGRVVFDDTDVNPGRPAIVQAAFDETRFTSPVLRTGNERSAPVRIKIAKTTRSADGLSVAVESVAVIGDARGAQAVHALSVINSGERAFVGEIRLPVLPGGTAIQVQRGFDERRASIGDGQIISRSPILPGRNDIAYTYPVQASANGIRLRRTVQLPTQRFDLLTGGELEAKPSGALKANGTADVGQDTGPRKYRRYSADDLDRGDVVAARVVVAESSSVLRIAGPIAAALVAIVIIVVPLVRRRRTRAPAPEKVEASA